MVGFQAILDQSLAFTALDKNLTVHAFHLNTSLSDVMWESNKLELFKRLFINLSWHILLVLGLNTYWKQLI